MAKDVWDFLKEFKDYNYSGPNVGYSDDVSEEFFGQLPDFSQVGQFDSYGNILKEIKKISSLDEDEANWMGKDDWSKRKKKFVKDKKYALANLAHMAQQKGFIPDDSYGGAQDRYDRPPELMKKEMDETTVKELLSRGSGETPSYEGPFGKLGEYFSKNAAARDKLFSMMGSMGRELVKPIQPGQDAAGALVPTLSRGLGKGGEEYAAKQAAAAKTALDMATAQQKISPMQYYSSKMQEARLMVPSSIEGGPDSVEGRKWIGKYLMSIGMPSQVVDLQATVESMNLELLSIADENARKEKQALIDSLNRKIQDLVTQSIGGSSVTNIVPYNPVA